MGNRLSGNRPSEYNGVTCQYGKDLPPSKTFDFQQRVIVDSPEKIKHEETRLETERQERLQIEEKDDSEGSIDSESDDEYSIVEKCIEWVYDSEFLEANKTPQMHIEYTKTIVSGDDNDDQAKQETQVDLSKVPPTYSELSESKISTQTTVKTLSNTVWSDDPIDAEELEDVQLFMLSEYTTRNGLTSLEKDNLLHILVSIGAELKSEETLILTKVLCALINELEYDILPTIITSGKIEEFLARMLNCANIHGFAYSSAMEQCLSELLKIKTNDLESQLLAQESQCLSTYDRFRFLQSFCALSVPLQDQKYILHLVQVYQIPYHKLEAAFNKLSADPRSKTQRIPQLVKELIDNEQQESFAIVLNDIKKIVEIEDEVLEEVEAIMSLVNKKLYPIIIELDHQTMLSQEHITKAKETFKQISATKIAKEKASDAIVILACALKSVKPFIPNLTQLTALTILIVSNTKSVNRRLEVSTGEGKSCIIALFAAVLGMQDEYVDISSLLHADIDADEWRPFFSTLDLTVAGMKAAQEKVDPDEFQTIEAPSIDQIEKIFESDDDHTKVVSQYTSKADEKLAVSYSNKVAHDNHPASFLEVRALAAGKEGHGIIVHKEVNGKFVKSALIPGEEPIINLLYTPSKDDDGVGHYDALIKGKRISINSDASNCLYHAVAYTLDPSLTHAEQKAVAQKIRQEVSEKIAREPKKWSKLIKRRKRLEEIKGGKQLAMIGAGKDDFNLSAIIIPDTYKETVDGKTVTTNYTMKNGVATKSTRTYDKKIKVDAVNDKRVSNEVRMTSIKANVTGLMFVNKRTPHTQSVPGMINRYIIGENSRRIKMQDSEVAFHGAPSCAGMGAGQGYATTLITSKKYNDREKTNWTVFKKDIGEGHKFRMWFTAKTDRITSIGNAEEYIKKINEQRTLYGFNDLVHESNAKALKKRLVLMEKFDPRIYRVKSYDYCYSKGREILKKGSMGEDFELGVPKRFNEPNQPAELENEFTRAKKKVVKHMINKVPTYNPSK